MVQLQETISLGKMVQLVNMIQLMKMITPSKMDKLVFTGVTSENGLTT